MLAQFTYILIKIQTEASTGLQQAELRPVTAFHFSTPVLMAADPILILLPANVPGKEENASGIQTLTFFLSATHLCFFRLYFCKH